VTFSNPAPSPRFWQRVAERADQLCTDRNLVLFPLGTAECRRAIKYFNDGTLWMRPPEPTGKPLHMFAQHTILGVATPERRSYGISRARSRMHSISVCTRWKIMN